MGDIDPVSIVFNAVTLSLAVSFLLIVLWYDVRRTSHIFLAIFLFAVIFWYFGLLFRQVTTVLSVSSFVRSLATSIEQIGFIASGMAVYALVSVRVGLQTVWLRVLLVLILFLVVVYNIFLIVISADSLIEQNISGIQVIFFILFDVYTVFILWYSRKKIVNRRLIGGIVLFIAGQGIYLANPALGTGWLATAISGIGALLISVSIVQEQIINPLKNRNQQLESLHKVSLAVTGHIGTDMILNEISKQATLWVEADAACIFLMKNNILELVAMSNLPSTLANHNINIAETLVGQVVLTQQTILIENYQRYWQGQADIPNAFEVFGSVIGVPLSYDQTTLGALLVISGKHNRIFGKDDARLLEMLGIQAALALRQGEMFSELRELDRIKGEMIRMTSHDLKNPLQAAFSNLELLSEDIESVNNTELKTSVRNIERQLERMNRIISGILDLERAKLAITLSEMCNLHDIVLSAVDDLKSYSDEIDVAINVLISSELHSFQGDAKQFERVVINLLENALKFSHGHSKVDILSYNEKNEVILVVRDYGIGIPEEAQHMIFERFYRVNQQGAEHISGSGLGLSFVKTVVELHRGRIWVESEMNKGSAFFVALPVTH